LLFHGSGTNFTKRPRLAISCHFATSHSKFVDVTGTMQDPLERETREMARVLFSRKTQDKDTVESILSSWKLWIGWQPRIRVVKGDKSFDPPEDPPSD